MFVIGLVGGVASGKSFVAAELKRLGAGVLDADRAGHEVLAQEDVKEAIRRRWGAKVFDASGQVNRPALARIVFAPPPDGPRELTHLEQLTHPRIATLLRQQMRQSTDAGGRAAVLDAPVLFEAGWHTLCDVIVFVEAPREARLTRAKTRGWSEEEFARREMAQKLLSWKRSRADAVIDNGGSTERTAAQVEQLWRRLKPRIDAQARGVRRPEDTDLHSQPPERP
jgi:dephospho-CoA kinase